jgi:hypothetical protein
MTSWNGPDASKPCPPNLGRQTETADVSCTQWLGFEADGVGCLIGGGAGQVDQCQDGARKGDGAKLRTQCVLDAARRGALQFCS